MEVNNLTDRSFWKTYWKNYQYGKVPRKMFFDRFLPKDLNHKCLLRSEIYVSNTQENRSYG